MDALALELWGDIKQFGWEMTVSLRTIELTRAQADGLLARLRWLTVYIERLRREQQAQIQEG